jgi:GT2 family glycosyltransferase
VRDSADGWTLAPRPAYDVLPAVDAMPDLSLEPDTESVSVALVVDGWPDDVRRCVSSLLEHTPARVLLLDNGDVQGAGAAVHELAADERVTAWHVERGGGWAAARTALLRADRSSVQVWAEPSVEATGDVLTPLVEALGEDGVGAAGPYGVRLADDWLSFSDAEPGDVDALNGYLVGFRRAGLLAVGGPHPKARYYRNADLELGLALREAGWRVVMTPPVPLTLHRHRGYHDTDADYRERESKRNYDRLLQRFRPRHDTKG